MIQLSRRWHFQHHIFVKNENTPKLNHIVEVIEVIANCKETTAAHKQTFTTKPPSSNPSKAKVLEASVAYLLNTTKQCCIAMNKYVPMSLSKAAPLKPTLTQKGFPDNLSKSQDTCLHNQIQHCQCNATIIHNYSS